MKATAEPQTSDAGDLASRALESGAAFFRDALAVVEAVGGRIFDFLFLGDLPPVLAFALAFLAFRVVGSIARFALFSAAILFGSAWVADAAGVVDLGALRASLGM